MTIGETQAIRTTSAQTKTSSTSFSASQLVIAVGAGETYSITGNLHVDAPNGHGGFKGRFTDDASTSISGNMSFTGNSSVTGTNISVTSGVASTSFFNPTVPQLIQGEFTNSGAAGNVTFEFAQNTSDATGTTLQQNSQLLIVRTA